MLPSPFYSSTFGGLQTLTPRNAVGQVGPAPAAPTPSPVPDAKAAAEMKPDMQQPSEPPPAEVNEDHCIGIISGHKRVVEGMGYVPGVCWNFLRTWYDGKIWHEDVWKELLLHFPQSIISNFVQMWWNQWVVHMQPTGPYVHIRSLYLHKTFLCALVVPDMWILNIHVNSVYITWWWCLFLYYSFNSWGSYHLSIFISLEVIYAVPLPFGACGFPQLSGHPGGSRSRQLTGFHTDHPWRSWKVPVEDSWKMVIWKRWNMKVKSEWRWGGWILLIMMRMMKMMSIMNMLWRTEGTLWEKQARLVNTA